MRHPNFLTGISLFYVLATIAYSQDASSNLPYVPPVIPPPAQNDTENYPLHGHVFRDHPTVQVAPLPSSYPPLPSMTDEVLEFNPYSNHPYSYNFVPTDPIGMSPPAAAYSEMRRPVHIRKTVPLSKRRAVIKMIFEGDVSPSVFVNSVEFPGEGKTCIFETTIPTTTPRLYNLSARHWDGQKWIHFQPSLAQPSNKMPLKHPVNGEWSVELNASDHVEIYFESIESRIVSERIENLVETNKTQHEAVLRLLNKVIAQNELSNDTLLPGLKNQNIIISGLISKLPAETLKIVHSELEKQNQQFQEEISRIQTQLLAPQIALTRRFRVAAETAEISVKYDQRNDEIINIEQVDLIGATAFELECDVVSPAFLPPPLNADVSFELRDPRTGSLINAADGNVKKIDGTITVKFAGDHTRLIATIPFKQSLTPKLRLGLLGISTSYSEVLLQPILTIHGRDGLPPISGPIENPIRVLLKD